MPDVILLRSADDDGPDRYLSAFGAVGLAATCAPVLAFRFPHGDALRDALADPDRYAGLIVTSPRAVEALVRATNAPATRDGPDGLTEGRRLAGGSGLQGWRGAPAYAVGPKTAAALREIGFDPRGDDAGTAADLAARIASDAASERWLFLCGNRRRDALPDALRAATVPFDETEAYVTETRTDLTLPPGAAWIVFFSPSGVEAVRQSGVDAAAYRIATIGPTTADAVRSADLSVDAVAPRPTPDALVGAIRSAAAQSADAGGGAAPG